MYEYVNYSQTNKQPNSVNFLDFYVYTVRTVSSILICLVIVSQFHFCHRFLIIKKKE